MRAAVLDLFCGACGGWSLGMHRAGYQTVAACEIDPWRRAVFARNFPGVRMYDDVRCLTADRLRRDLGRLPSVIVGSPPCQDASTANHHGKGVDGERTGLFFEAIRLVSECQPVWGCFENVPGLRARGVDRVLAELEALDYACWPLVVGAVHAGAPHRRNRVWIVFAAKPACEQVGRAGQPWREVERAFVPDADWQGQHDLAGDAAAMAGCAGNGGAVADASGAILRQQPWRGGWQDGTGAAEPRDDGATGVVADADEAGLEVFGRISSDPGSERAAFERDGASGWDRWNGGLAARARELDDGLPRGVARAALAAYGDAVVPQITEAIGRAMSRLLPVTEAA